MSFLTLRRAEEASTEETEIPEAKPRVEYSAGGILKSADGQYVIEEINLEGSPTFVRGWKEGQDVKWDLKPDVPLTAEIPVKPLPIPPEPFLFRTLSDKPEPKAIWSMSAEPLEYGSDLDLYKEIRDCFYAHTEL